MGKLASEGPASKKMLSNTPNLEAGILDKSAVRGVGGRRI